MALKIDITDSKGVKTRYHAIKAFTYREGKLVVRLYGYVNQSTRETEKKDAETNGKADAFETELAQLRSELNTLIAVETPTEEQVERIKELSETINIKVASKERPAPVQSVDTHYNETDVELAYFEPLSLEAIYQKLAEQGKYAGAESI